ncbi:DUF3099 domain-containing protein [Antrihabitans sp. YC3-6]|uniref:DUF3099 domain-containing protein n=1 Tax=Antrihabitans stalagmiti TaxID=2799499 RepID=A0A934NUA3_9NOCA|nr:DUF3099 domain-containing protein [Antrihabitans stalagmiti]MBJ8341419.1 DUF3099 domain-containing protein [Antrihabitans stalagmiti]
MAGAGFQASENDGTWRHPAVITQAADSVEAQHRARVKRYTIIMSFRIPALLLAALTYSMFENAWISVAIIAVSIPLPWVAVLIANDRPPRRKNEPRPYNYGPESFARTEVPAIEPARHTVIDG